MEKDCRFRLYPLKKLSYSPKSLHRPVRRKPVLRSAHPQWIKPSDRSINSIATDLYPSILKGRNPQDSLLELGKLLGERFRADCCVITGQSGFMGWSRQPLPVQFRRQFEAIAQHTTFQSHWQQNGLLIPHLSTGFPEFSPFPWSSWLAIRTRFQGKINGVIYLMGSSPHDWKESDLQSLQSLSPQVAIALSHTQLEQQVQHQFRYQAIHDQLTTAIRTGFDLPQIFDLACEGVATVLNISRALVVTFKYADPNRNTTEAKVTVTAEYPKACQLQKIRRDVPDTLEPEQGTWVNVSFQSTNCSLCQTLLSSLELLSNPPLLDAAPAFQLESFPALALLPIEHQGIALGCLVLQHSAPHDWTPEALSFLKLVAAQLSTAVIQVRSLQQFQSIVTERTAQLQRSLEVQAKLYDKTRQQVDQLQKLNEEREEFLSTVSHELLTPLTSMGLAIRMLREASLSPDRQARYLDILEQQCQHETQLINDMLALRKLENNPSVAQHHRIDLRYLIRDAVHTTEAAFADKGMTVRVDLPLKSLTVFSEPESLTRIFLELLSNARKYADPHSEVLFGAAIDPDTHQIILKIQNIGLGIQSDEIDQIFDKFKRSEAAMKLAIQGTGLGLTLVKRLVEHVNGTIAVSSHPLPNCESWSTCFTLTLPPCPNGVIRSM
jgi:signal transduction histidine kinase